MKPETAIVMKPTPNGLDCGDQFSEEEMKRINTLRAILKASESNSSL